MYTIVRFTSESKDVEGLQRLGEACNAIRSGTFRKLSRQGCRFTLDVCDAAAWPTHVAKIDDFLSTFRSVFIEARRLGIDLMLDVAVHSNEDLAERDITVVGTPSSLMRQLSELEIEFCVSIYNVQRISKAEEGDQTLRAPGEAGRK